MSILTREQLYAWVWDSPAIKVASELGISGSALAKKCRQNGIPTPGRGYWRQRERGKSVVRTQLPHQESGRATFLGEITDERAEVLTQLASAMVSSAFEPATSESANLPPPVADTCAGKPGLSDVPAAGAPIDQPGAEIESVSRPSRPAIQLKVTLEPSEILAVAAQAEMFEYAQRFIVALNVAGQGCDTPTRVVLALWMESAMDTINQVSPIDRVIKDCQAIAAGEANPPWFASRLKSTKAT